MVLVEREGIGFGQDIAVKMNQDSTCVVWVLARKAMQTFGARITSDIKTPVRPNG